MKKPKVENIDFGKLIKRLEKLEIDKLKYSYSGDASECAYMKYVLLLLKDISKKLEPKTLTKTIIQYRKKQKWN